MKTRRNEDRGPLACVGRCLRRLLDPSPAGFIRLLVLVVLLGGFAVVRQHSTNPSEDHGHDRPALHPALKQDLMNLRGKPAAPPVTTTTPPPKPGERLVLELRTAMATWLVEVATFQEVYAVDMLKHWFHHAKTSQVREGLENLTAQDKSAGWKTCAIEGETCRCPSKQIRYGHTERSWLPKDGVAEIPCTLGSWGGVDVAVGMIKQCQCYQKMEKNVGVKEVLDDLVSEKTLKASFEDALREAYQLHADETDQPSTGEESHYGHVAPEGNLWLLKDHVASWILKAATFHQLVTLARLHDWLENTRDTARITVSMEKAAAPFMKENIPCDDGKPEETELCAGYGDYHCRAACSHKHKLMGSALHRRQLCASGVEHELLWSCDSASHRVPSAGHPHSEAQGVLDIAAASICSDEKFRTYMDAYLDCEFLPQYLRWTADDSEWIDEAYVTYVAGKRDSKYEWQATNLVRSVDVFSSRPIIVVVYNSEGRTFVPPLSWHRMPNVIVMEMHPIAPQVSFNFNKIRAMISTRVRYGIELDTDQIIAPGFDSLFASTRREMTARHPWPMLPVHWMSRDAKKGEPYHEYAYPKSDWPGPRTMRWGHAHPSWSYWTLAFLCDLLHERLVVSYGKTSIKVWDLNAAKADGLLSVFDGKVMQDREVKFQNFMREDEDMLNIALWRDDVKKQWCKFDLEFGLFAQGTDMDKTLYWDAHWYPDGVPIVFTSMHNTKRFEETDWLLTMIAICDRVKPQLSCPKNHMPNYCKAGSTDERALRRSPKAYAASICCCYHPRQSQVVYWGGYWFDNSNVTPMTKPKGTKERLCVMP